MALSAFSASLPLVPPCAMTAFESYTAYVTDVKSVRSGWVLSAIAILTVCGSTTSMGPRFSAMSAGWSFRLASRSKENFTSAAVSGFPLANFTPLRSLNSNALPPSTSFQLSASSGLRVT